jgi:hypothetical protein
MPFMEQDTAYSETSRTVAVAINKQASESGSHVTTSNSMNTRECLLSSEVSRLLYKPEETCIADGLCGLDLVHLAVKGGPAHAMRLVDGIASLVEWGCDFPVLNGMAIKAAGAASGARFRCRDTAPE